MGFFDAAAEVDAAALDAFPPKEGPVEDPDPPKRAVTPPPPAALGPPKDVPPPPKAGGLLPPVAEPGVTPAPPNYAAVEDVPNPKAAFPEPFDGEPVDPLAPQSTTGLNIDEPTPPDGAATPVYIFSAALVGLFAGLAPCLTAAAYPPK